MKEIEYKIIDSVFGEFNQELIGDKVKLQNKVNKLQRMIDMINYLQPVEDTEVDEFVLPERWCIKLTKDNIKLLSKWRGNDYLYKIELYGYVHCDKNWQPTIYNGYTEITFEQFKKYVLNK